MVSPARLIVLACVAVLLSGCATASNCAGWTPIKPSRTDKLTTGTADQILKHNRGGEAAGCW